jgi:hypothetical protein
VVKEKQIHVTINNKAITESILVNSKTYVPLKPFFETIGLKKLTGQLKMKLQESFIEEVQH